jgi:alpha-mannosidase
MKRGEDDDFSDTSRSTFVFRIYEAYGGHARAKLPLGKKTPFVHIEKIAITNLLEDELEVLQADDAGTVTLDFHGFEVKTVKMTVKHIHKEQ